MTQHTDPPILNLDQLPAIDIFGRLPRWCSLPVPGTNLLVLELTSMRESVIPVDIKRAYSIGGSSRDDITITGLRDLRLALMHHRSGSVYISVYSPSHTKITASLQGGTMTTLSCDPSELVRDEPIEVCGVRLTVTTLAGIRALRDCLRNFCTDDDQTHNNTVKNMSKKAMLQNRDPNMCISATPSSVKRRKKRRKPNESDGVVRSVKFLDM